MFSKLFARITESSLMEEDIPVRYTFVMLLAIADPTGLIVGTDVAIARRLNMPLVEFQRCIAALGEPDPDSNSKEREGRRVVQSEGERGYQVVNYEKYRDLRTEEDRRAYMRDYMREYRGKINVKSVKLQNSESVSASASTSESFGESENLLRVEEVYAAYPRRVGKHSAMKKIGLAIREFGFEKVFGATKAYAEAWNGEKDLQFCPYPETWYGKKRFNDDPATWERAEKVVNSVNPVKDDFWRDTKRLELVDKEIATIEGRATQTALETIIEPRDREKYDRLRAERRELKGKMGL